MNSKIVGLLRKGQVASLASNKPSIALEGYEIGY